jgi:hypothetical protein
MPPRQRDRDRQQREAERERQRAQRVVHREAVLGERDDVQGAVEGDGKAEQQREPRAQPGPESGEGHADTVPT